MRKLIFAIAFLIVLGSCNSSSDLVSSETKAVQFQLIDSLVVESLFELYLVGKNEQTGQYLFKDKNVKEILLTDAKGGILAQPKLKGVDPDQVAIPWEIGFAGNEIAVKEFSAESKVHFFDLSFKKLRVSDPIAGGLNTFEIAPTRNGVSFLKIDEKSLLIGSDPNAVNPELMAKNQQNSGLYEKSTSGFIVDVNSGKVVKLNLYPDSWQPRREGKWVGPAYPFIAVGSKSKIIAVLPRIGDQLFFYQLVNNELVPKGETLINHPKRKRGLVFNPEDEPLLYPNFFDLKAGGNLFLIHFYTEVPRDLYLPMKAQGIDNAKNPEHVELLRRTRRSKYILSDDKGNQTPIEDLPIEGQIHYMDANDVIYIKPESKEEKDYNVFYRYRVKM
ncbi:hypothetical protein [Algoriphagus sp.]|uniref:hypothetical protein n=1 Tax=Algoriphagus sp. TaxID=1872435 RepID=UPI00391D9B6A